MAGQYTAKCGCYIGNDKGGPFIVRCPLHLHAPDLYEALEYAAEIVKVARNYFPKSIRNSDRFNLENTNATITKALSRARGE